MIYTSARHLSPAPYTDASPVEGTDATGNTESTTLGAPHPFRQPDEGISGFLARVGVIAEYVEPAAMPYRLFKSVLIRRLTDDEAVIVKALLDSSGAKLSLLFDSVEYFVSDDPLFTTLVGVVGAAMGVGRASELLAAG